MANGIVSTRARVYRTILLSLTGWRATPGDRRPAAEPPKKSLPIIESLNASHMTSSSQAFNFFLIFAVGAVVHPGTLRKISGIRKFGQKILSKMRARVHRKFQDPHFSRVTASQKSGITILAMHLRF